MTEPKNKKENLSQTAKTHIKELWIENNYGRKKEISSKYLEKGILVEEIAMTLYTDVSGNFYKKNSELFSNEYITGTPDIIKGDRVIDLKASWDLYTFIDAELSFQYEMQLQAYMWLTGKPIASLVYCLVDTPNHLIVDEQRRYAWKNGIIDNESDAFMDICNDIEKNMTFSDIPKNKRIKSFSFEFNPCFPEIVKEKIGYAMEYYNSITI